MIMICGHFHNLHIPLVIFSNFHYVKNFTFVWIQWLIFYSHQREKSNNYPFPNTRLNMSMASHIPWRRWQMILCRLAGFYPQYHSHHSEKNWRWNRFRAGLIQGSAVKSGRCLRGCRNNKPSCRCKCRLGTKRAMGSLLRLMLQWDTKAWRDLERKHREQERFHRLLGRGRIGKRQEEP